MRRILASCVIAIGAALAALSAAPQIAGVTAPPAALRERLRTVPEDVAARAELIDWYYEARQLRAAGRELDLLIEVLKRNVSGTPTPAQPVGKEPRRAAVDVDVPVKVKDAVPEYPMDAVYAKRQGIVLLDLLIDPKGKVDDVRVIRGVKQLDHAAVRAARKWQFAPTLLDGVAVPVLLTVPVRFAFCGAIGMRGFVEMARHFSVNGFATAALRSAESARKDLSTEFGTSDEESVALAENDRRKMPEPRKIRDVRPEYPAAAVAARIDGVVTIEAVLDEAGQVTRMKTLRCDGPLLEAAALKAVGQWAYTPSMIDGKPVKVIMTVTVTYTLR